MSLFFSRKHRMKLACKYCFKMTDRLSGHLRQLCRKGADEAEILALVQEARATVRKVASNLSVVRYQYLKAGVDSDRSLDFFIGFLESKGCFIRDKPSETQSTEIPVEEVQKKEKEEAGVQRPTSRVPAAIGAGIVETSPLVRGRSAKFRDV
eukprot:XP_012810356.1 PREDICTED: uncharacterized protein LOC100489209 isoform X2 [Xenopus tropicalis]